MKINVTSVFNLVAEVQKFSSIYTASCNAVNKAIIYILLQLGL